MKKWDPKFNRFSYHRICRLEGCEIEIHTNRKDHYFCEPNHQQLYWRRIRKQRRRINVMILDLEKRIEVLEKNQSKLAKRIEKVGKEAVKAIEDFITEWEELQK